MGLLHSIQAHSIALHWQLSNPMKESFSCIHSKVHSYWLVIYMNAAQPVPDIFKLVRSILDRTCIYPVNDSNKQICDHIA